jgi:hypothetical protein
MGVGVGVMTGGTVVLGMLGMVVVVVVVEE